MSTDAQPAASSAAPVVAPPSFAEYEAAQNALDRGITPESKTADQPAAPAPAQPVDQAASTEVTPEGASETPKPRKTAEDRKAELAADVEAGLKRRAEIRAEIAREEARLQALRQPPQETRPTPASEPAPAETFPDYDAFILQPGNEEKSYETYIRELARFETDQRWAAKERERQEQEHRTRESQTVQERNAKFRERLDAAGGQTFLDGLSEDVRALRPSSAIRDERGRWTEQPTSAHALTDEILGSDVGPQLLRHFTDHPDDLHRLMRSASPAVLYREFGKLEARISGQTTPPAVPAPKTVTDAPPPPVTLGKRPAAGSDPVESALARRDFRAYEQEQNRRDLAARGRR